MYRKKLTITAMAGLPVLLAPVCATAQELREEQGVATHICRLTHETTGAE